MSITAPGTDTTPVAGLAATLNSGAMTNSIQEIPLSEAFPDHWFQHHGESHPVIGAMIKKAVIRDEQNSSSPTPPDRAGRYADVFLQFGRAPTSPCSTA